MSSPLKILVVAAEVFPFAKTGGLADVAGSLPSSLKKQGHDVRVLLPKYACTKSQPIHSLNLEIEIGKTKATLYSGQLAESVPVYLIENNAYFDREYLYGEPGSEYSDNAERFAFLCQAALEACKALDFQPDIIHCNDWHTGLIPAYLKASEDPWYSKMRTLFSIHNLGYQGNFPMDKFPVTALPDRYSGPEGIEFYGQISFLKSGLVFADALNTVSPRYCKEIQSEGFGMEGILQQRSNSLTGILNGVDYSIWNPATDKLIAGNYASGSLSQKQKCREALINKFSLKIEKNTPLLCMITRLSSQKGIDLLMEASKDLKDQCMVVLGEGDSKYENFFSQLAKANPDRFAVALTFDDALAHQILAGSDILLMPSIYEPCGLTQMYALKYGTVPIVSSVGGLDDSIQSFDGKTGTGFKFASNDLKSFQQALQSSLTCFADKDSWECLINNGMNMDFSWDNAAQQYSSLFQDIQSNH
jgi:starch synthase